MRSMIQNKNVDERGAESALEVHTCASARIGTGEIDILAVEEWFELVSHLIL